MQDAVFRALSDPTRRRILELLGKRDLTAGEIVDRFSMTFPTISHHLAVLKGAGLVKASREGKHIRYRLNTTVFQDAVRYLLRTIGKES